MSKIPYPLPAPEGRVCGSKYLDERPTQISDVMWFYDRDRYLALGCPGGPSPPGCPVTEVLGFAVDPDVVDTAVERLEGAVWPRPQARRHHLSWHTWGDGNTHL